MVQNRSRARIERNTPTQTSPRTGQPPSLPVPCAFSTRVGILRSQTVAFSGLGESKLEH